MKSYKTNQTLLRTFIDNTQSSQKCSIFDENKVLCENSDVENRNIATIVHIKGVRLTNTSFQLDIENKQILLLEDTNIFDTCMLKNNEIKNEIEKTDATKEVKENAKQTVKEDIKESVDKNNVKENDIDIPKQNLITHETRQPVIGDVEELNLEHFKETNLGMDTMNSNMKLKTPQDVYMHMYKMAKRRARETRKQAIKAYIDAQNIKAAYLIKDDNESGASQHLGTQYPYQNISDSDLESTSSSEGESEDGAEYENSEEEQSIEANATQ